MLLHKMAVNSLASLYIAHYIKLQRLINTKGMQGSCKAI